MTGDPAFDYTAHYAEATPGSTLYESEGKTVALDSITQHPDTGDIELAMTATNDSEASDFLPVLNPAAFLSTTGKVDITEGNRTITGENLVPGQSASLEVVVPRGGNEEFGYVAYSLDQDKRPDGAVLQVTDGAAPAGAGPQRSLPAVARFDRAEDEGEFWPVKMLWRYPSTNGSPSVVDGVAYVLSDDGPLALDAATGSKLWMNGGSGWNWDDGTIKVADGVVYFADGGLKASDAATGELLWHFHAPRHWYSSTTAALKGKAWKCVSCNEISRPWPDASVATVTTIQPDQRSHGAARAACITTASPRALSGV